MAHASDPIAATPAPPYYAVIFTSRRADVDHDAFGVMAARMVALAAGQEGFLGVESAREGVGITVSYWRDMEAIRAWRAHVEHAEARRLGREGWYAAFRVRIARVERDYGFDAD